MTGTDLLDIKPDASIPAGKILCAPDVYDALKQFVSDRAKLSPLIPPLAHSLAGYLTRNGQRGDWTEMEKEIEQFMEDSKVTR